MIVDEFRFHESHDIVVNCERHMYFTVTITAFKTLASSTGSSAFRNEYDDCFQTVSPFSMEFTPFMDFTDQIGGVGNPTLVKGPQSRFYFDGCRFFNVIRSFFCGVRIVFVFSLLLSLIVIIIVRINPAIGNVIVSGLS
jgi:hypothetical protein